MGIRHLNRFLRDNCPNSIRCTNIADLSGKRIAVDISIYLYKYEAENALLENMYVMLSVFRHYNIIPIFIFDGKPPPEKKQLLIQRIIEKKEAEEKYNDMQANIENATLDEKQALLIEMDKLKRQFIRVTEDDIRKTKELLDAHQITYYLSSGEADELCAYFTKSKMAWGCLSDDMDMFLYGCPYVLRNISLVNHTVLFYNTRKMLSELELTEQQFCEIMVLSGTDYNMYSETSLAETIKWFYEYRKYCVKPQNQPIMNFYEWLYKYTKYIKDYENLLKTYDMFQITNNKYLNHWENIVFDKKNDSNNALIV